MNKQQKKFIKRLYDNSEDEGAKAKLEEVFPNILTFLKNDVWYKYSDASGYLFKFTSVAHCMGYGISPLAGWTSSLRTWSRNNIVEAKPEYVAKMLIKVAAKKGFKKGAYYSDPTLENKFEIKSDEILYNPAGDNLHPNGGFEIIFDGRYFAPIVDAPVKHMTIYEVEKTYGIKVVDGERL